jgi:hypothetical protein
VMTSCAFDMVDLRAGEGVNYVARQLPTMSWNQTLSARQRKGFLSWHFLFR